MAEKKGTSRQKSATYLFLGGSFLFFIAHTTPWACSFLVDYQPKIGNEHHLFKYYIILHKNSMRDDGANKAFEYKITGCSFGGQRIQEIKKSLVYKMLC